MPNAFPGNFHKKFVKTEFDSLYPDKKYNTIMLKQILKIILVVAVAGAIFSVWKFGSQPAGPSTPSEPLSIASGDWVKGGAESKAVLIEYSDFQCPACGVYHSVVKQLTEEFGDTIQFAYRHFPLRQIHKNANLAAQAAEAAGVQGKFWEMHDMIFENQKEWSEKRNAEETFIEYGKILGLNIEQFKAGIKSKEIKEKIEDNYQSGLSLKIKGTPTFFLNGEKLNNPRTYEEFKKLIEESINNSSRLSAANN